MQRTHYFSWLKILVPILQIGIEELEYCLIPQVHTNKMSVDTSKLLLGNYFFTLVTTPQTFLEALMPFG